MQPTFSGTLHIALKHEQRGSNRKDAGISGEIPMREAARPTAPHHSSTLPNSVRVEWVREKIDSWNEECERFSSLLFLERLLLLPLSHAWAGSKLRADGFNKRMLASRSLAWRWLSCGTGRRRRPCSRRGAGQAKH